jgi:hypothetical protein
MEEIGGNNEGVIPRLPLTPELAKRDPEAFRSMIVRKLENKHSLAFKAWNTVNAHDLISLATVRLNSSTWVSNTNGKEMHLGAEPLPAE